MTRSIMNSLASASVRSGLSDSRLMPSSYSGPISMDEVSCAHATSTDLDSGSWSMDRPHVLMMSKKTVSLNEHLLLVNHRPTQLISSSSKASMLCEAAER